MKAKNYYFYRLTYEYTIIFPNLTDFYKNYLKDIYETWKRY